MYKYINIFFVALKLGLLSFGGPTAHLGYFYDEYVKKRKWLDEKEYSDLVALCQFLSGPASRYWYRNYKRRHRRRYYIIYRIYAPICNYTNDFFSAIYK